MRVRTTAAVLLLGLVSITGCSDDVEKDRPEVEAAATSGPGSEHLLIHGTVSRGDKPVAGAEVWVTLFPEDGSDAEIGETVDTFDTDPVETSADGRYTIELDPDELSSRYFNGSFLNFDVGLVADDQYGFWGTTVSLTRRDFWRSDERARVGDAAMEMSFDLDAPTITLSDSYGESEVNELPLGEAPPGAP